MPIDPLTLPDAAPELWAGVECTVNRVEDRYLDQCLFNGHRDRPDDLDRFAELGVRALRYPVLWENTAPDGPAWADWTWPDARLARLRELGVRPIVGLVHHGSGPKHTSLIDSGFADGLAEFARAVAERYPWVTDYTPVNEPLTTARFSGLYGHWYPHGRDALTFARALLTQCRAVVLSMRAVRAVNPDARLVQTEDLGKTWSTPALRYQADFENERRWLSFDLLCGRVDESHWMWQYLTWLGVDAGELRWFLDNPCPPDVFGINHYLTSERFLDERLDNYPAHTHGDNGRHRYADVEAVRVVAEGPAGPGALLAEVWDRYQRPVAVTEVHLGCTREEQMRWLREVWEAAAGLRRDGTADVCAVTAWSLLGAYDWNSLLTRCDGCYEPGVFDLRGPAPRPTALAAMLPQMAAGRLPEHPVLETPGWWRRPMRLLYPPVHAHAGAGTAVEAEQPVGARPVLILGGDTPVGHAFGRLCDLRGLAHTTRPAGDVDLADRRAVRELLRAERPWAVVNADGFENAEAAEAEPFECFRRNHKAAAVLAEAVAESGVGADAVRLLLFSSDRVFEGAAARPGAVFAESDPLAPRGVYARSKAAAESASRAAGERALVVRTASLLFGPWDAHNPLTSVLRALEERGRVAARARGWLDDDAAVSATYIPDLVHACLDLLIDGEHGVWHLANEGAVTPAELARRAAEGAGLPVGRIGMNPPARVSRALTSERGNLLPGLDTAIGRYLQDSVHSDGGARSRPRVTAAAAGRGGEFAIGAKAAEAARP